MGYGEFLKKRYPKIDGLSWKIFLDGSHLGKKPPYYPNFFHCNLYLAIAHSFGTQFKITMFSQ